MYYTPYAVEYAVLAILYEMIIYRLLINLFPTSTTMSVAVAVASPRSSIFLLLKVSLRPNRLALLNATRLTIDRPK